MKKPSKAVEKYLKYLKLDSIIESYKTTIKVWDKRCRKSIKNNDFLFETKLTLFNMNDIRNQFCITTSGYIYDGNKIIADIRKTQTSLNNERKKIDQMTYEELRNDGIDRLYADDAIKYIKVYISKLNVLISSVNQKEFDLINDTLAYVTFSTASIENIVSTSSIPQYKALIGMDPITRDVSVTWYMDGKDIMTVPSSHKPEKEEDKDRRKELMHMLSKINEINDKVTEQMHDTSVSRLINATEKHSKEISRLTEAVEKLETSESDKAYYKNLSRSLSEHEEPEKVHYEKPVVGKSPEEVTEKKSFSVTSEN